MKKCMLGIVLTASLALVLFAAPGFSQGSKKVQEHPMMKAFPGFKLDPEESEHKEFNAYQFRVFNPKTEDIDLKQIKGKYWRLYYAALDSEGNPREDISQFEVAENFKTAALEKGGKILFDELQ